VAVEGTARVVVDVSSYSCFPLPLPLPPAKCIRAYLEGHLSHHRQRVKEAWARRGARKTAKKACACVRACVHACREFLLLRGGGVYVQLKTEI